MTAPSRWRASGPRLIVALAALLCLAGAAPAQALSIEPSPIDPPALDGVTSWDLLGKAVVLFGEANGQETVTTMIPPEIEGLDGTEVSLKGYMFPIDAEPELRHFLLVEYPADCPFCLAAFVEPSRMVEVSLGAPIAWHDDPVVLSGRLEVVHNDADGLVYRLHQARLLP